MTTSQKTSFPASAYIYPILMVLLIWIVFWVEQKFGYNLKSWGVRPREWIGLRGIFFSPFLHGSTSHLYNNSLPLLFLSMALLYFYRGIAFHVLIFGGLLTGLLTWLMGRTGTVHIGASGIVYLLASFLFFKGIWSKNMRLVAVSLIVVFIYGSMIWGIFPQKERISWEGHMAGLIAGIACAIYYRKYTLDTTAETAERKRISRREAEFLQHFDEEGNFVPASEWREKNSPQDNTLEIEVNYEFKSEVSKDAQNNRKK
ncbi:MAG TPA: rhomboid family intramembrane serine protease [Flavobacteriaceae bacterium]|nr:rhomboid family intramembrane serine protease [Flavobacteriaceae bacterium]